MNIDLGHPIAYGRTAEIYAWQEGEILKLFYDWFSLEDITYEAKIAQAIHASGLPVPEVSEVLRVNDRNGLVYERVYGSPMWEIIARQPWSGPHCARRMAELHAEMHASPMALNLPSQRQKLIRKIRGAKVLPAALQAKTLSALEVLPDGDRICHGDFHPNNILVTAQGETIIDWIDATKGNPLADVARSSILIMGAIASNQVRNPLEKMAVRLVHTEYIHRYFKLRPGGEDEYHHWLPVVAAARLSENIPEVEKWLIAQVERSI
jgi:aminoglycoside phosphotransferase (APT) family kinase protein